jgi:membrane protease YdiL (CAAX protease family)
MPNDNETSGNSGPLLRRERLVEVSVFLFLIVPSMILSLFAVKQGSLGFGLVAISTILRDLALVGLVSFFLWRNREPIGRIGWKRKDSWNDAALGVALFVPLFVGAGYLDAALRALGFSAPSTPLPSLMAGRGAGELALGVILVVVIAVAEETIFRGYLILRFREVTGSTTTAVLLSALVFSIGHGYEGTAGVITVGVMGIVFAAVYLWRGSLVAPIVMHFLQDFVSIVLHPLVTGS